MNRFHKSLLLALCSVSFVSYADNMSIQYSMDPVRLMKQPGLELGKSATHVGVILTIENESDLESLVAKGAEVTYRDGNLVYATLPKTLLSEVADEALNLSMSIPRQAYPTMDVARSVSGVDEVHKGVSIDDDIVPYTGKGVLIGVVDGGIDPHHIAFTNADGESRIAEYIMTHSAYESPTGQFAADHYNKDNMSSAPTDFECGGHGTHTASVAGGYGAGTIYGGVAPDAELVLVTMGESLYDDEIMYGMKSALNYGKSAKKPIVVNFSLGAISGPHDGTGMMASTIGQTMRRKGQILCFAAGNDAKLQSSLERDFSVDSTPVSTAFAQTHYGTPAPYAYMQAWSADDKITEVCVHVIDTDTRQVVYTSDYVSVDTHRKMSESLYLLDSYGNEGSLFPELDTYFDGMIFVVGNVISQNKRYVTELLAQLDNVGYYSRYALGMSIKSDAGAEVMMTTSASRCFFKSYGVESFVTGNGDNSISDYCTSSNVVAVGAWNARKSFTDIYGNQGYLDEGYHGPHNGIGGYSSYGRNYGKEGGYLPHVLAPGTNVVAAVLGQYYEYYESLVAENNGYYWGTMTGTSMACPFATGVIALWLEAKSDLNRDQVLEIISATAMTDEYTEDAPERSGYGKIDAYNGLKYIYTNYLGVESAVAPDELKPIIRHLSDEQLEIVLNADVVDGEVMMCDMSGNIVATKSFSGNIVELEHRGTAGVYILSIKTEKGNSVNRILVK